MNPSCNNINCLLNIFKNTLESYITVPEILGNCLTKCNKVLLLVSHHLGAKQTSTYLWKLIVHLFRPESHTLTWLRASAQYLCKLSTIWKFLTLDSLVWQISTHDTVNNLNIKETSEASTQLSLNNRKLQPKLLALNYLKLKLEK